MTDAKYKVVYIDESGEKKEMEFNGKGWFESIKKTIKKDDKLFEKVEEKWVPVQTNER